MKLSKPSLSSSARSWSRKATKLDQLLREHPELREPNPERQQALEAWLQDHLQEESDDGTQDDRETGRETGGVW